MLRLRPLAWSGVRSGVQDGMSDVRCGVQVGTSDVRCGAQVQLPAQVQVQLPAQLSNSTARRSRQSNPSRKLRGVMNTGLRDLDDRLRDYSAMSGFRGRAENICSR